MSEHADLQDRRGWSVSGDWRKGVAVTSDDLRDGSAIVERVTSEEWFKGAGGGSGSTGRPAGAPQAGPKREWQPPKGKVMGFGKYATKLMVDVREDDPRYWQWCIDEVNGFRAKAGDLADEP